MLRLLEDARAEIEQAAVWYDDQVTLLGLRFLDRVSEGFELIETFPTRFASVDYLESGRDIRRYLLPGFPYLIIYEVRRDEILVVAVAHGHRRPGYWAGRLDNSSND